MALSSTLKDVFDHLRLGSRPNINIWKTLAIIFFLLNLKTFPFAWHLRLIRSFITHTRARHRRLARSLGPSALFQPMITTSHSPFLECDYNLHKSNSTYFSDFDLSRMKILTSLATSGIETTMKELKDQPGRFGIALGGVHMNFKREIGMYERYEIWTRLLSWDRKWFYGVTHFVKKGAVKPTGYLLQPWKRGTPRKREKDGAKEEEKQGIPPNGQPFIFASGISKYVFKKGRLTIPPERVWRNAGLLPPKPSPEEETPPVTDSPAAAGSCEGVETTSDAAAMAKEAMETITPDNAKEMLDQSWRSLDDSGNVEDKQDGEWTWERIEKERLRGLRLASMFDGLQGLNEEFLYEGKPALGIY